MAQPQYELRALWKKHHEESFGTSYQSSIHRDAAQIARIIQDIGFDETKALIDYYFKVSGRPDFTYFVFNYDRIHRAKQQLDKDLKSRQRIREATRLRMEKEENASRE